jgi:uncharacterized membrane protein
MDLNTTASVSDQRAATALSLRAGIDHAALENDGPKAFGDRMGTPAPEEKVLWKGRPSFGVLAQSAFHTRTLGLYFVALIVIALMIGNTNAAIVAAVLGTALLGLLYLLAWLSARSTLYILTDARLIMRIGIAIEKRINIPLKQVKAAHFRARGKGLGDIALELNGERLLGTLILWPHVRPGHYNHPQPMLRAVPDAAILAQMIAEARARYGAIERNLTESKDAPAATEQSFGELGVRPIAQAVRVIPVQRRADQGLEGAPA